MEKDKLTLKDLNKETNKKNIKDEDYDEFIAKLKSEISYSGFTGSFSGHVVIDKDEMDEGFMPDPEQFAKDVGVDLKIWYVKAAKIGFWDGTLRKRQYGEENVRLGDKLVNVRHFRLSCTLERVSPIYEGFEKYIDKIPTFKFSRFKPSIKTGSGVALEVAPLDAHVGKFAWLNETTYRNYDTKIAAKDYEYAIDKILNWSSPFKPEKIFYILGQDLFHVDNLNNKTTRGDHTMDVDGRMPKIFEMCFTIVTESIYKCRSVAPVEVIWSPGNHDYMASMALCYAIAEHFRNDEFVTVDIWRDDGKTTRKARLWGNLLVGWTHRIVSRQDVWGNELAQQFPDLWGKSVFREWHHGDQHKKKTMKLLPEFTSGGVVCRQLTALSPVDKWHFENLFTDAVPGGEAYLWSKDCGVFSNFIAWTGQYDKYRNTLIRKHKQEKKK